MIFEIGLPLDRTLLQLISALAPTRQNRLQLLSRTDANRDKQTPHISRQTTDSVMRGITCLYNSARWAAARHRRRISRGSDFKRQEWTSLS